MNPIVAVAYALGQVAAAFMKQKHCDTLFRVGLPEGPVRVPVWNQGSNAIYDMVVET